MIRDYQAIHQNWFLKGKQRLIPTYGQHRGVKLIGALDYETGDIICIEEEKYDAEIFLKFLNLILDKYPNGKIIMVLDNARIHHAKLIQPFLELNKDRLELMFLPPYSPDLNMIEGLWKWLKECVVYNVFYSTVNDIRKNVRIFLNEIAKEKTKIISRLCLLY